MISSNATHNDEPKTLAADPRFDVDAPRTNPLVASAPISVTRNNAGASVAWANEAPTDVGSDDTLFNVAANQAQKVTFRFPHSARAHANLGIALAKAGKIDTAIAELKEALSIDPSHLVAGLTLGRVLSEHGRFSEATEVYKALEQRFPTDLSVLLSLAYLALREGQPELAERYIHESLKVNRKLPHARFLLGLTQLERGHINRAISSLREATRLDVRTSVLHHALGVAYAVAGDHTRAERSFRAALTLDSNANGSLYALCETLLQQGKANEVLELLKPRIDREEALAIRDLLARGYIILKRFSNARNQLMQALARHDESLSELERTRLLNNIAVTFVGEGNLEAAEQWLLKALAIGPGVPELVYENLGHVYIRCARFEDAIKLLNRGCEVYRDRQPMYVLLSSAYARLGLFDYAIRQLRPFWESRNADANTSSMLGWLYEWTGEREAALEVLQEAYKRNPSNPNVINNFAYSQLMQGNVAEAKKVLDSLPHGAQPTVELIATRGLLHLVSGDVAQGTKFYEKAQQLARESGNNDLAKRVRQKLHLELARLALKRGDVSAARSEIRKGLSIKPAVYPFDAELERLAFDLGRS